MSKKASKILSLVMAVIMASLFMVNALAAEVTSKKTYYNTQMMPNQAGNYNVSFTTYMKPTVNFTNNNTDAEVSGASAYATIAWNRAEALPQNYKDIALQFVMVQYYQPKLHYSEQSVRHDIGKPIYITSLLDESADSHDGYIYTSPTVTGTALDSSVITSPGSGYYNSNGFLNWTRFSIEVRVYSGVKANGDIGQGQYVDTYDVTEYNSTIINNCK